MIERITPQAFLARLGEEDAFPGYTSSQMPQVIMVPSNDSKELYILAIVGIVALVIIFALMARRKG